MVVEAYDSSGTVTVVSSAVRSRVLSFHAQLEALEAIFWRRYWFQGLLFSIQMLFFSPICDHAMPVTVRSVVHSLSPLLRAWNTNCVGCWSPWL